MQEFNKENSVEIGSSKALSMSERAEKKFQDDPEVQKKEAEEALDNPISEYFANMHPEVLKKAQERHYLMEFY